MTELQSGMTELHSRMTEPRPKPNEKRPFGNDLLSQEVALQVPSALSSLTAGFGMGPGVPSTLKSPKDLFLTNKGLFDCQSTELDESESIKPQEYGSYEPKSPILRTICNVSPRPLVRLSSTYCYAYTCRLSN